MENALEVSDFAFQQANIKKADKGVTRQFSSWRSCTFAFDTKL